MLDVDRGGGKTDAHRGRSLQVVVYGERGCRKRSERRVEAKCAMVKLSLVQPCGKPRLIHAYSTVRVYHHDAFDENLNDGI